jgi:hypothetical protein
MFKLPGNKAVGVSTVTRLFNLQVSKLYAKSNQAPGFCTPYQLRIATTWLKVYSQIKNQGHNGKNTWNSDFNIYKVLLDTAMPSHFQYF